MKVKPENDQRESFGAIVMHILHERLVSLFAWWLAKTHCNVNLLVLLRSSSYRSYWIKNIHHVFQPP